jgi:hypothetical protein
MGIPWLPHPPHNPDLAPFYFWLFEYFMMKLEWMFFDTSAACLAEVEKILGDISITE